MTVEEERAFIREQVAALEPIGLGALAVSPRWDSIIVRDGRNAEETISAWIVGEERPDGYKIIMRDDGSEFGLATAGFAADAHPVLVGWYGDLESTFKSI